MNTRRAETSDPRNPIGASAFKKVLKGFEIGGLPYTEVQSQLKRLLATGVSPSDLREVLRRSELIEPLPEYAYRDVQGLLDEAIEHDAAQPNSPPESIDQEDKLDPAALAAELLNARSALESEQSRARESAEALVERVAAEEALRSRLDTTLRESERNQSELRAARNSIASRDKVTAQMRLTLDERDAELATLRREHGELSAAREAGTTAVEQFEADLKTSRAHAVALTTELAASRATLESRSAAARESSASREKTLNEMRQTLAERDAQLIALQCEHSEALASLDAGGKSAAQVQADLQTSRVLVTSFAADLAAARTALESERRKNQEIERSLSDSNSLNATARESFASREKAHNKAIDESEGRARKVEEKLQAAQKLAAAANAELDGLRAQVASLQSKLRESDALVERLGAAEILPNVDVPPQAQAPAAPSKLMNFRGWRWNIRSAPRPAWIAAAVVLLAVAIWLVAHPSSSPPSRPASSSAELIQPAATVPPAGQLETASTTEKTPLVGAAAAAPMPVTPAMPVTAAMPVTKPSTDFQRCRAGGIDACYDAIRWRPSDPSLLSALGDALLRANRPADALRAYQRVAILAPNMPGVVAKISSIEAKLSAKRASGGASARAAPQMQIH
jgi:hypothetical protein